MSYTSIHNTHERFGVTVMFVLLGTGLLAMAMMFIHPSVAILIFWMGLLIAGVWALVNMQLRRLERAEVRKALSSHHCPICGHEVNRQPGQSSPWRCDECGAEISADGDVLATSA